jgi:uncharacterized protein YndB with AHSA1/START domain
MPALPSSSLQLSLPNDTTIVFTRTFNAPRHLLWQAMFTPDTMRRWTLPPPGCTLTHCQCHPRPGGLLKLVFTSNPPASAMTLQGVFTEVTPHERAVHTETMTLSEAGKEDQVLGSLTETHEFKESDAHSPLTTLRITQTYPSKESRDTALASGMDQGMEACYQQLDKLLAQQTPTTK